MRLESEIPLIISVVESVRRINRDLYPAITFFSDMDQWRWYATTDDRTCMDCIRYEEFDLFPGSALRSLFPYLTVEDSDHIRPNHHPNCRCILLRVM